MKILYGLSVMLIISLAGYTQETVTDYDGNVYNTVTIGTQVWLKENLNALHYSDGSLIPDVVAYDNEEANAAIYGRLYTWDAAMKNSIQQMAQGACPDDWHVASANEWVTLENFLGGASVAGGKMKSTELWDAPNTGATNSSGFSILPGGEYDAYYTPNVFRQMGEAAVLWTSTQTSTVKAREKYMTNESAACSIYDWYKVMKYSVRCVRNTPTGEKLSLQSNFSVYPTLVNDILKVSTLNDNNSVIHVRVISILGEEMLNAKKTEQEFYLNFSTLTKGVYIVHFTMGSESYSKKIIKS